MNRLKHPFPLQVPTFARASDLNLLGWQSLVFYNQLRFLSNRRKTNGFWINFSSKSLKKRYGKHYASHIRQLAETHWIEVNPRYRNHRNGFTKSFRLSSKTFCCKHKDHITFLSKKTWLELLGRPDTDNSDLGSEYLRLIKQRHDLLCIPSSPRCKSTKALKAKLECKMANVHRGENRRIYSTIIQAEKKTRQHVVLGTMGKLINVDITAMVQQILNIGIKDQRWEQWITDGFAETLCEVLDLDRHHKNTKKLFMQAISKNPNCLLAKEVSHYLRSEFPQIMAKIDELNSTSTVQMATQRFEASLIEEFIQSHKHLTLIPAHDGVFCGESQASETHESLEMFLKRKGLLGLAKIKPDLPHLRRKTISEILTDIPEYPAFAQKAA